MTRYHRSALAIAGLLALLAGATACHGNAPGTSNYVPASTMQQQNGMQGSSASRDGVSGVPATTSSINASCQTPIKLNIGRDKTCHFREKGYKGNFTIGSQLNGIAVVRPNKGSDQTPFIIHALKPGSGSFTVNDDQNNSLNVPVVVNAAPIVSSCGKRIKIQILGIVTCQFHEMGYNGDFTIESHLSGIASISPDEGDSNTQFTVTGIVEGGGYFIVHGAKSLRVHVLVTTL